MSFVNRLVRLFLGLGLCAVGISGIVRSDLGVGPWDVLHQGLAEHTGMSFGNVGIVVGIAVLLLWIPLKQRLGPATFINVITMGLLLDVLLERWPESSSLPLRVALLVGGLAVLGLGISLYVGSGLGAGPRDGIMTGLHERGVSIVVARTAIEVSVLVIGWILGGTVGPGTIVFALGIGPMVHHSMHWFMLPPRPPRRAAAVATAA